MTQVRVYHAELAVGTAQVRVYRAEITTGTAQVRVYRAGIDVPGALVASAGIDRTVEGGELVILDASGSSGMPTSAQWTQTAGPTVALSGANTTHAIFRAPATTAGVTLGFHLHLADIDGQTSGDDVAVHVQPQMIWRVTNGQWVGIVPPYVF